MKIFQPLCVTTLIVLAGCGRSDVYRQVSQQDAIRFFSRSDSVGMHSGNLHAEGLTCGVIGDDGKEIGIALVSTTVDQGQIETKDFGILKIEMNSSMQSKLFATESQIKKLRALQASRP